MEVTPRHDSALPHRGLLNEMAVSFNKEKLIQGLFTMRHDVSGYKKSEGFSPIEPAILWLRPKRCDGVALIALQCVVRRVDKRSASTDPFEKKEKA